MTIHLTEHVLVFDDLVPDLTADDTLHDLTVPQITDLDTTATLVLSFRLHTGAEAATTPVVFEVLAGTTATPTTTVFSGSYGSSVAHSVHEILPSGTFDTGTTNTIRFHRTSGAGVLDISDVYLLAKRNAAETVLVNTAAGGPEG